MQPVNETTGFGSTVRSPQRCVTLAPERTPTGPHAARVGPRHGAGSAVGGALLPPAVALRQQRLGRPPAAETPTPDPPETEKGAIEHHYVDQ
jgi:hypothetical protein